MKTNHKESEEFCGYCHVGSLHPDRATYARWHDGQFVILPGVAAWRCDFCGEIFYDNEVMSRLVLLLGPESDMGDEREWYRAGLGSEGERGLGGRRLV